MRALVANNGELHALWVFWNVLQECLHIDFALLAEHRHLLGDVLQLAHVAWPLVLQHEALGIFGERDLRQVVFLGHLTGEEAEQHQDVLAAIAQGRHLDGDGVQTIVQVFAEASLADGLRQVDIGCSDDADVGLHDLLSAHTDVLTRFEHSQKSCLSGQRQFANLVEEDGALVRHTEITFALTDGSGVRSLLMTEQLAVDGAFRNRAAVDGKELFAPTG